MMHKKHFQLFADSIRAIDNANKAACVAHNVAEVLAYNPRFDRIRFFKACGLDKNGRKASGAGAVVAIKLNAKNDTNGHPRRVYVVLDATTGDIIDTMDEGYANDFGDLRKRYPGIGNPCEFPTTPGEYRSLLKIGEKLRAKKEGV